MEKTILHRKNDNSLSSENKNWRYGEKNIQINVSNFMNSQSNDYQISTKRSCKKLWFSSTDPDLTYLARKGRDQN